MKGTLIKLKLYAMFPLALCTVPKHGLTSSFPNLFFRSSCIFGLWMVTSKLANVGWSNSGIFFSYWRDFTYPINNSQQPDRCLHVLYPVWDHLPYHDYSCQVSCIYLYSTSQFLFTPVTNLLQTYRLISEEIKRWCFVCIVIVVL